MDKELLALLNQARANGANEGQLQGIVDAYNQKKNLGLSGGGGKQLDTLEKPSTIPSIGKVIGKEPPLQVQDATLLTPTSQVFDIPKATIVTKDGAALNIPISFGIDVKGIQERVNAGTVLPQDIEVIAKGTSKSPKVIDAYLKDKNLGQATDVDENISKIKQDFTLGIENTNKLFGTQYNADDILSSPVKSAQFLQQVRDKQTTHADYTTAKARSNAIMGTGIGGTLGAIEVPDKIPEEQFAVLENRLTDNIRKLTAEEATKAGLSPEQSATLLHQRLNPTDYAKSQEMRKPKSTFQKVTTSAMGVVGAVANLVDWVNDKPKENLELLNAEKSQYELELNKGLKDIATEKMAKGILTNDQTLQDEAGTLFAKVKDEDEIVNSSSLLKKQRIVDYVNDRYAKEAGVLEGTEVSKDISKFNVLFGVNKNMAKKYIKEGGFYDDPNYKDVVNDVANNPTSYFANNSPFGSVPSAFMKPFISIFHSAADLVGARTVADRHAEDIREGLFPERLVEGVKEDIAFDVKGQHFGMNVSNTINGIANLSGYMAIAAATGGAATAAGATAGTAARVGAWSSFGFERVDPALKEADKMGLNPVESALYAGMQATMMGEGGRILGKLGGIFPKVKGVDESIADIAVKISKSEIAEQGAKEALDKTANTWIEGLKKYGIGTAKTVGEFGKKTAEGAGVMAGFGIGDSMLKVGFGDKNVNPEEILPEAANAFFNGLFTMGVFSAMGTKAGIENGKNSTYKGMVKRVADNAKDAEDILKIGLDKGLYTQDVYNEKVKFLNTAVKAKATLKEVAAQQGLDLTPDQEAVWIANTTAEKVLRNVAEREGITETKAKELIGQADNLLKQSTDIVDGLTFNHLLEPQYDLHTANLELRQAQAEFADNPTDANEKIVLDKKAAVDEVLNPTPKPEPIVESNAPIDKAKELLNEARDNKQLGVYENLPDEQLLKEIAKQAQNVQEDGTVSTLATPEQAKESTINQFGGNKELVDAAIEAHPLESLISEKQKSDVSVSIENKKLEINGGLQPIPEEMGGDNLISGGVVEGGKTNNLKDVESTTKALENVSDLHKMPNVSFHGSKNKELIFGKPKEGKASVSNKQLDFGTHFTDEGYASFYSGDKGKNHPAIIDLKDPLDLTKGVWYKGEPDFERVQQLIKDLKLEKEYGAISNYDKDGNKHDDVQSVSITANKLDRLAPKKVSDALKQKGYDGIIYEPYHPAGGSSGMKFIERKSKSYIVLDNSAIKEVNPQNIAEAYHKAKADNTNPELIKAVETALDTQKENTQPLTKTEVKDKVVDSGVGGDVGTNKLINESKVFETKSSEALDKYGSPKNDAEENQASKDINDIRAKRRERDKKLFENNKADENYDEVHDAILVADEKNPTGEMPEGYSATVIDSYYEPILQKNHTITEVVTPKGDKYYIDVNTYGRRDIGETYGKDFKPPTQEVKGNTVQPKEEVKNNETKNINNETDSTKIAEQQYEEGGNVQPVNESGKFKSNKVYKKGEKVKTETGEYFVNGLDKETQDVFTKAKSGGLENQEHEMAKRKVNIVNSKYFNEDTDVAAEARSWFDDKKQPTEKDVRNAMIWSYDGYHDYQIKSGGGSASDHVYISSFKTTIADPKTGNDKDVVILKKYSTSFKDVLITIDEIQKLQDATENQQTQNARRTSNLQGVVNVLVRHNQGFPTTSDHKVAPQEWIDKLQKELTSEYSKKEINNYLDGFIKNIQDDLKHEIVDDTPERKSERQQRADRKIAAINKLKKIVDKNDNEPIINENPQPPKNDTVQPNKEQTKGEASPSTVKDKGSGVVDEGFTAKGGNKIVDENTGNPIEVFHGTNAPFESFDKDKLGSKNFLAESASQGFFFAGDKKTSEAYTGLNSADIMGMNIGGNPLLKEASEKFKSELDKANEDIRAVIDKHMSEREKDIEAQRIKFLESIKGTPLADKLTPDMVKKLAEINIPLMHDINDYYERAHKENVEKGNVAKLEEVNKKILNEIEEKHFLKKGLKKRIISAHLDIKNPYIFDYENKGADTEGLTYHIKKAKKAGHDGVIFKNLADGGEKDNIYVVFKPEQIKITNKNILEQLLSNTENKTVKDKQNVVNEVNEVKGLFGKLNALVKKAGGKIDKTMTDVDTELRDKAKKVIQSISKIKESLKSKGISVYRNDKIIEDVDSDIAKAKEELEAEQNKLAGYKPNTSQVGSVANPEAKYTIGRINAKNQQEKITAKRNEIKSLQAVKEKLTKFKDSKDILSDVSNEQTLNFDAKQSTINYINRKSGELNHGDLEKDINNFNIDYINKEPTQPASPKDNTLNEVVVEQKPETPPTTKEVVEGKPEEKIGKYEAKAIELAKKIDAAEIPQWLINTDPTIKKSGISGESIKEALKDAAIHVGRLLDKGVEFADAIKEGADRILKHMLSDYPNQKPKPEYEEKIRIGFENYYKENFEPPKPPIENNVEANAEGDGRNELKEMALNIPNEGQLREYASKGTIEKYHGETPENEQGIIVQELTPALQHGENMIDKAKEVFGEKDYVDKTLQFIEDNKIPTQSKALMYISLENDLARQKLVNPENLDIQKKQDLVRSKSQAFLRESSLAINFGKLRKIGEVGFDISQVTDKFFSSKELEEKTAIEKSIEADADKINKSAEQLEAEELELQDKINEAVESEIAKIHEKLPTERRKRADKAIAALENFQQKIRSKTYDATIGIPVALIDGGITIIKRAIKAGVNIADAIDLGIQHIKDKYGKEWTKEGEFKSDMIAGFRDEGIKKEASGTPNQIIKSALIESGFGREITVTMNERNAEGKVVKKDGKPIKIKEQRSILDWKKLAGEEGSIEKMKENVDNVLESQGYSKEEISNIQKGLTDKYNDLRASVIEHSLNELNKRNQKTTTQDQKSAAKKLAELYNYGLFEKAPVEYNVLLAKAIGIDRLSPERFQKAHELGKALEVLYSSKFNGRRLNDLQLKTAIQSIEEKMRILLHDEAQGHGSSALKLADIVRTYMDATQRMILNNLGQAIQNPLSGFEQSLISNIDRLFDGGSTKELRAQKRNVAMAVYKNMVLSGGVNYGDVNTTFVSRGNLDAYINKMSDNKIFHAIASTAIGKTTLDAADSFYKAKLTEQKFAYNLIKVLTERRLVGNKLVEGMNKKDAINYVSERLTGQSYSDAQKTAKEIIAKVNSGGKKIVGDTDAFVDRLANDIVKAALINGNVITTEQVTAAYNAAYRSSGRSLGHIPNNPISEMVQGTSAKIEKKIDDAIKDKQYKKAALLTYQSIFFRNIMNPFVGGGTNWVVLKLEKNGLGLVSGLYNSTKTKLDMTSESGLKKVEEALYEEARDRDAFMRGAIGGTTALLTAMLWFGVTNTDDYRKWRNKNKWATKYLDYITPEAALAVMAKRNKELGYYVGTVINKNINYDKSYKVIKGVDKTVKGKPGEAAGQFGEAVGGSFGIPLPWRLVRDGQNIWLGAEGKEPYKVSSTKSKGFWEGALKAGMVDYIKNNPVIKK